MASSKGKIVLQAPRALHQMAAGKPKPRKPSVGDRDAEYRRILKIQEGARLPKQMGGGAVHGNGAAAPQPAKGHRKRKPTRSIPKPAPRCLRCGANGKRLNFGYCRSCWS